MTQTTPDQSASATPRRIEYRAISELIEDPKNPKSHAIDTVTASVGRFGFIEPVVVDERTGYLISGHGRTKVLRAMQERGEGVPNGVRVDEETGEWQVPVVAGWSSRTDLDASGALIALNRAGELGGWVDDSLLELLDDLSEDDEFGFEGVGFTDDDRAALELLESEVGQHGDDGLDAGGDLYGSEGADDEGEKVLDPSGQGYKTLDVLVGEPKHQVKHGEVYRLGGRHYLVIAKLAREHELWSHLLEGRVFAPYPDIYLALGKGPKEEEHLFVQPNAYLAGHLLDKWTSVHGEDSIVREVSA